MARRLIAATVLFGATALALIAFVASRWHHPGAGTQSPGATPETGAMTQAGGQTLEALETRLDRLERLQRTELVSRLVPAGASTQGESDLGSRDRRDRVAIKAQERHRFESYFAGLDELRAQETPDPAWATQMGTLVREAARTSPVKGFALSVGTVECGSRLCKVELSYDGHGVGGEHEALMLWVQRLGSSLPEASVYNDSDSGHAVAYFARDGSTLPAM